MIVANIPSANYSLEEKVVGTWIDGKPLYQKTFTGKVNTNNQIDGAIVSLPTGIRAVYVEGYMEYGSTENQGRMPVNTYYANIDSFGFSQI